MKETYSGESSRDRSASDSRVRRSSRARRAFFVSVFGVLGVLAPLVALGCGKERARPNILLITLDTTRPDHLSCYGHTRRTSPHLDELAEQGVLFTNAVSTTSWTLPSHASLFTGKFPSSHGATQDEEGNLILANAIESPEIFKYLRARGLARDEKTLAGILSEEGYRTGGVAAGPWMKKMFGLDVGFDFYDDRNITEQNGRRAEDVTDVALDWLDGRDDRPFFLFLNYFDAHLPYEPPLEAAREFMPADQITDDGILVPESPEELNELRKVLYDAEILAMDQEIGRLFDGLKERGWFEETWIVVTADHGELIGEHGQLGHGFCLFEEEIRIPLIIKDPGREVAGPSGPRGSEDPSPVQLPDLFALLLEGLGIELPEGIQGRSPPSVGHPIYAESYLNPPVFVFGDWRAIYDDGYKYIWNSQGNDLLFHLDSDPKELRNLVSEDKERVRALRSKIEGFVGSFPPPGDPGPPRSIDEKTLRTLQNVGYLESEENAEPNRESGSTETEAGQEKPPD